eukprot:2725371-Prorocentrum_lima.AAC.1
MSKPNVDVVPPWSKLVARTALIFVGSPRESDFHDSADGAPPPQGKSPSRMDNSLLSCQAS